MNQILHMSLYKNINIEILLKFFVKIVTKNHVSNWMKFQDEMLIYVSLKGVAQTRKC